MVSVLRGRLAGWPSLALLAVVLAVALAIVAQSSFAAGDGLRSTTEQGSSAYTSSQPGLVPAVSRSSFTQADSNVEDRVGFGLVAVLFSAVAAFTLSACGGRLPFLRTAPSPGPGRSLGARAPPVAPAV